MEQLSGLDSAFVHQDSPRTPMHVTAALVYDVGSDHRNAIRLADIEHLLRTRLRPFPVFRRRLQRVPLGMDTPYWIEDPTSDPAAQLGETALQQPGSHMALQALLSDLHGRGLDLTRPLWRMTLVHAVDGLPGLPTRCQVVVLQLHHAAIDGMSLAAIVQGMHSDAAATASGTAASGQTPDRWDMWTRLNVNTLSRQFRLLESLGKLVPGVWRASQVGGSTAPLPPILTTRTGFNRRVEAGRTTGGLIWPRRDLLAIKRAARHVTLNDIALAIVAGGLRTYLQDHGRLPSKSLACGVPISLRGANAEPGGNRISTMRVGLPTAESDPLRRLRLAHRYAVAGKQRISALGTGTVMDISNSLAPGVLAGGTRAFLQASQWADLPVPFHTMLSNVPGPDTPFFLGRARLVAPLGFGPVRDDLGLFHVVSGSHDRVSLSFAACTRLLPDAEFYRDCLDQSLRELLATASP